MASVLIGVLGVFGAVVFGQVIGPIVLTILASVASTPAKRDRYLRARDKVHEIAALARGGFEAPAKKGALKLDEISRKDAADLPPAGERGEARPAPRAARAVESRAAPPARDGEGDSAAPDGKSASGAERSRARIEDASALDASGRVGKNARMSDRSGGALGAFIFKNRVLWLVGWIVAMVAFDQASKLWAQDALSEERNVIRPKEVATADGTTEKIDETTLQHVGVHTKEVFTTPIIGFSFKYAENRAAAFSLTQSIAESARRPMLLFVSLAACALIAVWYMRLRQQADALLMTAFALIIAGALGNFLDCARLWYVIDFIDFYVTADSVSDWLRAPHTPPWGGMIRLSDHWPRRSNIADSCIVSGAIGVVLRTLRPQPTTDAPKSAETP